jgi:hypothetical protein
VTYCVTQIKVSKMPMYRILSLILNQIRLLRVWRSIFYEYCHFKCRHRPRACSK